MSASPSGPHPIQALVIGGLTGAVTVLEQILPGLPRTFPAVLVVVHVLPSAPSLFTQIFAPRCAMRVREPNAFDPIEPGTIYFAPADYHLLVEQGPRCALSIGPPVHFSRPSIDVLFESAAAVFGATVAGLVLTGASADGARGLAAIAAAGGATFVQDPSTAEAPQMPQAALGRVPEAHQLKPSAHMSELLALEARA